MKMRLSTVGPGLIQETFEKYVTNVKPKSGLGDVLKQVIPDLPPRHKVALTRDLNYILNGRTRIQHKKWMWELVNSEKYESTLKRLLACLCPQWKLIHQNRAADKLLAIVEAMREEMEEEDDKIAELEELLRQHKRPRSEFEEEEEESVTTTMVTVPMYLPSVSATFE
jgi:hypothetical protein